MASNMVQQSSPGRRTHILCGKKPEICGIPEEMHGKVIEMIQLNPQEDFPSFSKQYNWTMQYWTPKDIKIHQNTIISILLHSIRFETILLPHFILTAVSDFLRASCSTPPLRWSFTGFGEGIASGRGDPTPTSEDIRSYPKSECKARGRTLSLCCHVFCSLISFIHFYTSIIEHPGILRALRFYRGNLHSLYTRFL